MEKVDYDVLVIGGSFAGLSAATSLARARKSVLVLDEGKNRNRFTAHAHNVLGHDGKSPAQILQEARDQFAKYAELGKYHHAKVTKLEGSIESGFTATTEKGEVYKSKRVVIATGVTDQLPEIGHIWDHWGNNLVHCPHCHGYFELSGEKRIGILHNKNFPFPVMQMYSMMVGGVSEKRTYFANGVELPTEFRGFLTANGWKIVEHKIESFPPPSSSHHESSSITLHGETVEFLYHPPTTSLNLQYIHFELGKTNAPFGEVVTTDPQTKETTVKGVYAAGDLATQPNQVMMATQDGLRASLNIHMSFLKK